MFVPPPAFILGVVGAVPFLVLAIAAINLDMELSEAAKRLLFYYGAIILSFLGGIHWGLAIIRAPYAWSRYIISVLPALIGWALLLLPLKWGLIGLAGSVCGQLGIDWLAVRSNLFPGWYLSLRAPLTALVTAALVAGALF